MGEKEIIGGEEIEDDISQENELMEIREEIKKLKEKESVEESNSGFTQEPMIGHTTKMQWNGSSYMSVIPKEIISSMDASKGDKLKWRIIEYDGVRMIAATLHEKKEFKVPTKERKEK